MAKQNKLLNTTLIIFSFVFILFQTLYPFNFLFKETYTGLDTFFFILGWGKSGYQDILLNVLLFVPLSFGLTGYLMQKKSATGLPVVRVILLLSFGLSYSIEILQIFQPSRFPSLVDVISNCLGGLIGYICFHRIQQTVLGYVAFAFIITPFLQLQTNVSNWDNNFHLLLGNELTEDRPWEGYVSEVYIADRSISKDELAHFFSKKFPPDSIKDSLVASYRLSGRGIYPDKKGGLPDLVSIGKPDEVQQGKGVFLGTHHWLKSASPADHLTLRIMETSQFTLIITVATNKTIQTGPARIVSLSEDPGHRNFTLGQDGSNLIFRLRTPFTGNNGTPEVIVEDIFSSTNPRNIVISYDGSTLQVYVDEVNNSHIFEFSPGAVAFSYFFPLKMSFLKVYKILWYAIIFIPLGILVSLNNKIMKSPIILISGGILLPSLILEGILVNVSGRGIIAENLLISILFIISPAVISGIIRLLFSLNKSV